MNASQKTELLGCLKSVTTIYSIKDVGAQLDGMRFEAKAAYHIRIIADQLMKAASLIPTHKTSDLPNDIAFYIWETKELFEADKVDAEEFSSVELAQVEDLYYATYGKAKEYHEDIVLRLKNNFAKPGDQYYAHNDLAMSESDVVTVAMFKKSLETQQKALRHHSIMGPLEFAVKMKNKFTNVVLQNLKGPVRPSMTIQAMQSAGGLQDVSKMPVAMIFGTLAEKYHAAIIAGRQEEKVAEIQEVDMDGTAMTQQQIMTETLAEPSQALDANQPTAMASHNKGTCTCPSTCLCKPLCSLDVGEPCQCVVNPGFYHPEAALAGVDASNKKGTTQQPVPPIECKPKSSRAVKHHSMIPGYSSLLDFDDVVFSKKDKITAARLRQVSSGKPKIVQGHTAQDPICLASPKGRQAVVKRDRKASNGKSKHTELKISPAVLEKLENNGFAMKGKQSTVKQNENRDIPIRSKPKPTKEALKIDVPTTAAAPTHDLYNTMAPGMPLADVGIGFEHMHIAGPSANYQGPNDNFNNSIGYGQTFDHNGAFNGYAQGGQYIDPSLITQAVPQIPDMSMWANAGYYLPTNMVHGAGAGGLPAGWNEDGATNDVNMANSDVTFAPAFSWMSEFGYHENELNPGVNFM